MADEEERRNNEILIGQVGLGVVPLGDINHPENGSLEARLDTFKLWPSEDIVSAQSLAEKGFFYTGVDDRTKCFYCGNELQKWEPGDDPLEQHEKWFPDCGNLFLCQESSQYGGNNKDQDSQSDSDDETDFLSVQGQNENNTTVQPDTLEDMARMKDENASMRERKTCEICHAKDKSVVFIPCGHFWACHLCALANAACPKCGTQIKALVKVRFDRV